MKHRKSRWVNIRGRKIPGLICRYNPETGEIEVKRGRVTERVKLPPLDNAEKIDYTEK